MRAQSLVRTFGLLSLSVIAVIGVVVGAVLHSTVRNRAIEDAARTAEVAVGVGVIPLLTADDIDRSFVPLPPERLDEIDRALGPSLTPNGIVRIKVWNRQHWIVYSDNPALVGRWFAGTPLLEATLAGETGSEITDLSAPEEREEREFGTLLSVYVPLHADAEGALSTDGDGEVIGAFEIYLPYAPIAAAIRRDTIELVAALGFGLLLLFVVLYRVVAGAARTIVRQGDENLRRATTDELTGLVNRERFVERLDEFVSEGDDVSLLLFDVDGFQEINDTLGHDRGDEVIRRIGQRLAANVRATDVVARLGGDEFGVILCGASERHDEIAQRLLAAMHDPVEIGGLALDVRCSVGVSRSTEAGTTAHDLLRRSDIAMYAAKRDQTVIADFDPSLDHYSPEGLELVGEVRAGIAAGEFQLHYQTQTALDTGRVVGVEALVRWQHRTRGAIPPGAFIPTLERLPACRELTDHVLGLAVAQLAEWYRAGHDVSVAVNLSARDASDPGIVPVVADLLGRHGVPASRLHLELTEGTLLANPARTRLVLEQLRELGCEVAIDDFGTGYASLRYLTSLPITCLKIDQSFVAGLDRTTSATAIVRHSIELGHSLGLTVVAEGVEDAETLDALRRLGCDVVQGYLLGRPRPATDVDFGVAPSTPPDPEQTT